MKSDSKKQEKDHPSNYIPDGYVVSDESGLKYTVIDKKRAIGTRFRNVCN